MASSSLIRARIKGRSRALRAALDELELFAPSPRPLLIQGPTGSGKELAAALVHERSGRSGPLVSVNCGALCDDGLLESRLFGHRRGAFTSAVEHRAGLFEEAHGGTLFLDEVGEMSPALQAALLRVLQDGRVRRIGDDITREVDVRVVSATHRDLAAMVADRTFREDLLQRLMFFRVELPALRERGRDVLVLARHLLELSGFERQLTLASQRLLLGHDWPGNVRELERVICQAALRSRTRIEPAHLLASMTPGESRRQAALQEPRAAVLEALDQLGSAPSSALRRRTGLARNTLLRLLDGLIDEGVVARQGRGRATRYLRAVHAAAAEALVNARQQRALPHIQSAGQITRRQYAALMGVSLRSAQRDLQALREAGLIYHNGARGRASMYLVCQR